MRASGDGQRRFSKPGAARRRGWANPERLVWGTDWPHPRIESDMPDAGHLLGLFTAWTRDAAIRQQILVDNPALYDFAP